MTRDRRGVPTGRLALFAIAALLAGCATPTRKPALSVAPPLPAAIPAKPDIRAVAMPPLDANGAASALATFRRSCPSLLRRTDRSGLTQPGDWDRVCTAATNASDATAFFTANFRAVTLGDGAGRVTGYFEPEIAASPVAAPGYAVPLYRRPLDLVEADLGRFVKDLDGRKLRGRVERGQFVPYADRAAIMGGALAGQGLELAWAADPYEAFFLEIQGSGRLRYPDGRIVRIGYDTQNGRDYVAIGRVLIDQGRLAPGTATMDSIIGWLRANPAQAPAVLAANPGVVFFREIKGDCPVGAMGVALTSQVSVAADPAFVPLGAPIWVTTQLPGGVSLAALMVAQDTGGAIKGANRLDLFRGSGTTARAEAGALAAAAHIVVLLPKAAAARLVR